MMVNIDLHVGIAALLSLVTHGSAEMGSLIFKGSSEYAFLSRTDGDEG
jgi:hypothetical protein